MYQKNARMTFVLISIAFLMTTSACTLTSPLTQTSPLMVFGTLDETDPGELVEARIVLSRGKHVVEKIVPVIHNEFQAMVQMPVGQWDLTVLLIDTQGMVRFQSKPQSTQISFTQSNILQLVLQPAASSVQIRIELDNYIFKHVAMRARIHLNDDIHEVIRPDSLTPLETSINLFPGSYEFKIELYTESFRVGDKLGPSAWEIIQIAENEEVFITWSPVTEALQISGRIETLLPAPENISLTDDSAGIHISWDAVPHWDIMGYFVFVQNNILDRFQLLTPIPIEEPSYLHALDPTDYPAELSYVVAAVSASGLVGFYSPPRVWQQ